MSRGLGDVYKRQEWRLNVAAENDDTDLDEPEHYSGSYEVTPKAHQTQTLDTSGKVLSEDLVIHEVPYYQTSNDSGGVTSYIAKEGDSK